jgi:16S rRNA (uracil1498-N3)-methyltransferase
MTRLYCPVPVVLGEPFALPAAAARHAQVLRLQPGDPITLFDGQGGVWRARVLAMGRQEVSARAEAMQAVSARPARAITLAVGMPANERMDWLIEKATELGVSGVVPLVTQRTVVRLSGERADKRLAHWQAIAAGACEQSGRDHLPRIEPVQALPQWLAGLKTPASGELRMRLSLAPGATHWMQCALAPDQALCAALGPEGGWSESEERALEQAGFVPVSLGSTVLRAETAALTVLARWADAEPSTPAPAR